MHVRGENMKINYDILITQTHKDDYLIFLYNDMGDHVIETIIIDPIEYEVLFGLREVMVTRCKISPEILDRLKENDLRQQEVNHHEYFS
jgi:hypothetical protein